MAAPKGNKFAQYNPNAGRPEYWTDELIEIEAKELIEWARKDEAKILRMFAAIRGYSDRVMHFLSEKNEVFSKAFDYARTIIGCRRELMVLQRIILRDIPLYYPQLEKYEKQSIANGTMDMATLLEIAKAIQEKKLEGITQK